MARDKDAASGVFYRMMVEHVKKGPRRSARVCPAYDPKQGYELAGFVWLQGFNDLVDGQTYPNGNYESTRDSWRTSFVTYDKILMHRRCHLSSVCSVSMEIRTLTSERPWLHQPAMLKFKAMWWQSIRLPFGIATSKRQSPSKESTTKSSGRLTR